MLNQCKFCDIASKKIAAHIIFENENFISFLDINPLFPGHALLIPKIHYVTLYDLPQSLTEEFLSLTKTLGKTIEKALLAQGSFIAVNNVVSQSVPHVHIHLVPRNKGDGLKGFFWPRKKYNDVEEMDAIKEKIITALSEL